MPERPEGGDIVNLVSLFAERREARILALCAPHLRAGESVTRWIRARQPRGGREGFAYLTSTRLVVHWLGGHQASVLELAGVCAWRLSPDAPGGLLLTVERPGGEVAMQLPTASQAVTTQVKRWLEEFARSVPQPSTASTGAEAKDRSLGVIAGITTEKRSWGRRSWQYVVTLAGVVLTIVGIVLAVPLVPGPGLLVAIGGVALLASEYDWAKDALSWAQDKSRGSRQRLKARRRRPAE